MQKVIPTDKWRTQLNIFGVGELPPPSEQGVELSPDLARWAINTGFAIANPVPKREVEPKKSEITEDKDRQLIVDYLNQAEVDELNKIAGIGEKTVNIIVSRRPISVEVIGKTLSPAQIESIKKFLVSS